jgi:hypothetical protein
VNKFRFPTHVVAVDVLILVVTFAREFILDATLSIIVEHRVAAAIVFDLVFALPIVVDIVVLKRLQKTRKELVKCSTNIVRNSAQPASHRSAKAAQKYTYNCLEHNRNQFPKQKELTSKKRAIVLGVVANTVI